MSYEREDPKSLDKKNTTTNFRQEFFLSFLCISNLRNHPKIAGATTGRKDPDFTDEGGI